MINDHKMYCIAGVFWQMGKYEAVKCEDSEDTIIWQAEDLSKISTCDD